MALAKLKTHLEVAANVAVVTVVVLAVTFAAKQYFGAARRDAGPDRIKIGTTLTEFPQVDYGRYPKTLVLALNVNCHFCVSSIPFYQRLVQAQTENPSSFQAVAIFLNEEAELVKQFADEHKLPVVTVPSADFAGLKIIGTPTLLLVDDKGKVLDAWFGQLPKEEERNVFEALGVPYKPPAESATTVTTSASPTAARAVARVEKTAQVFDEDSPLLTIEPQSTSADAARRFADIFDVDDRGNVYLVDVKSMLVYDAHGALLGSHTFPPGFSSPFCVDGGGRIYARGDVGLVIYSPSLEKVGDLPLDGVFSKDSILLKIALDRKRGQLYLQVYDVSPLSQRLYKVDLASGRARELFRLREPVPFNPTYSPGAFDFAIGSRYVYVSDIREYKVSMFSPTDGSLVKTFTRPFNKAPIEKRDGRLPIRKMAIGGLGETLREYPPIFHLSFTNRNRLLVWTSRRDEINRQVVDVYDEQLKFLGVDLKYMNPGRNDYVFANNRVYAPDFGSGKEFQPGFLSPLEVPSRPVALRVFAE